VRVCFLFIAVCLHGVGSTSCVAFPFAGNGVLAPGAGEKLADVNTVVVEQPVLPAHPPISVILKRVVQPVTQVLGLVPLLILIGVGAVPLGTGARAPRVANSDKLEVHVFEIFDSFQPISMVESDTLLPSTLLLLAVLVLLRVRAADKVTLMRILDQFFEERSTLNAFLHLR